MRKTKKDKIQYVCQNCGFVSHRWIGRCSECDSWNSMVEERLTPPSQSRSVVDKSIALPIPLSKIQAQKDERITCQSQEFNRVLGGGIVPGSLVLIGGSPGVGKSTLMLQEAAQLTQNGLNALYVSGEESITQTKMRANRLGVS